MTRLPAVPAKQERAPDDEEIGVAGQTADLDERRRSIVRAALQSGRIRDLVTRTSDVDAPNLSLFDFDRCSKLSMALLAKCAMPVGEAARRTRWNEEEIDNVLATNAKILGQWISLIDLSGHCHTLKKWARLRSPYCFIVVNGTDGCDALAEYVCNSAFNYAYGD